MNLFIVGEFEYDTGGNIEFDVEYASLYIAQLSEDVHRILVDKYERHIKTHKLPPGQRWAPMDEPKITEIDMTSKKRIRPYCSGDHL